jgi:heptosyltransferase-2
LGDAVITTAMLAPLRARFPHARIDVLASPEAKSIFSAAPEVTAVHVFAGSRFARGARRWLWPLRLLVWAWRLRGEDYDLGIDVRGDLPHALLLWLARIPERVGWSAGGGGGLLTRSAEYVAARPELESRRALLALLGVGNPQLAPRVVVPAKVHRQVAALLPQNPAPVVIVHVGAGTAVKRWPVENFTDLLRLLEAAGVQPILVGTNADRALAEKARAASDGIALNWCGALSVLELAALCRQAQLFIGADSGPAHLAAAVGAPTLVLFSGTNHIEQWKPAGPLVRTVAQPVACSPCHRAACMWNEHPCMSGLRPAMVAAEAIAMLPAARTRLIPLPEGEGVKTPELPLRVEVKSQGFAA